MPTLSAATTLMIIVVLLGFDLWLAKAGPSQASLAADPGVVMMFGP